MNLDTLRTWVRYWPQISVAPRFPDLETSGTSRRPQLGENPYTSSVLYISALRCNVCLAFRMDYRLHCYIFYGV
jgi:hypothetical protein